MSKHITDTPGPHGNTRLARYTALEKRERLNGPHKAIETLERRPRTQASKARTKAFLKIEAEAG